MISTTQSILIPIAAVLGVILLIFLFRGVLKTVWKVARVLLILLAILVIIGYLSGYLEIAIR